jgi:UDP-glucose:(heptosyl)LPS alpha-1,3-glucosyltransferase
MSEIYPASGAIIHPTLSDTYGIVALEAMSHKLPIIISGAKYCGFSEQLNSDEVLIIENPKKSSTIKEEIQQLTNDQLLKGTLSEKGFKKSQEINWNSTLKKTIQTYKNIPL